ncbi:MULTISPECIES: NAD-dependent epimerase/dehydratase family protein [Enterococcus]|uniref:NAD-dependent epimerase/dehydratase domain-containing protein n=1 Tax=Candidatus Enterococcus ferrettii TaxID=2815324 RepID=A0ABV0EPF0_9ENTE|nr:NAD-dependent epimerase/dehydratase family protein [Enterococcus sp. 665A]MBO1341451.1 NAD-dependent epimerase/dehydratase family protein [Enterococcus sp. 665A]
MKRVLITGALGQIGSELTERLRRDLGVDSVIATDIRKPDNNPTVENGQFETLDVQDYDSFLDMAKRYEVDTIIHLAALLSATAEQRPAFAWQLNMGGLMNGLEVARELGEGIKFFAPSSIAAYGPDAEPDSTPQDTVMHPTTMYGVTKVAGELLENYYHDKYGVDTRSVRFPGLISYKVEPGGGTTDYAVDIFYEALKNKSYKSFIAEGTYMDMMYMDDAIDAIVDLMNADSDRLDHRNAFNITAMSFAPEEIAAAIKKRIPEFEMHYEVDPVRQGIAESWPNSIDCHCAVDEWNFTPSYDLERMTDEMLMRLEKKFETEGMVAK